MTPSKNQKIYLQKYFKETLGYGNKCSKCKKIGRIQNITKYLVEFLCIHCNKRWAFESDIQTEQMILIGMGIKNARN